MHPLLAKLTTCVCAAGTGAAVLPAAHAIHRHYAPHHAVHRAGVVNAAVARPRDCLPGAVLAGGALTPMAPLVMDGSAASAAPGPAEGFPFGPSAAIDRLTPASTSGGNTAGSGGFGDNYGGGGFYGAGGGGGAHGGGQSGGGITPANPPATSGGSPSMLPEPASWALMVIGFGTLGGALRLRQRLIGKGEVVEVKLS